MKLWEKTDEEFLLAKGWKKVNGYKIDLEIISDYDHLDSVYFEELEEFATQCEYWKGNDSFPEAAFECPTEAIDECYEEYCDDKGKLYETVVE